MVIRIYENTPALARTGILGARWAADSLGRAALAVITARALFWAHELALV